MTLLDIQSGKPKTDGRYVIFSPCRGYIAKDWIEPLIATWQGNKWHVDRVVLGWIGPLPVGKITDLSQPAQEYDL